MPAEAENRQHRFEDTRVEMVTPRKKPPSPVMFSVVTALAATGAGLAAILAGPFQYRCTVEYKIDGGNGDEATLAAYRRELLDHLWAARNDHDADSSADRWSVRTGLDRGTLRVLMYARTRDRGRAQLESLTDTFRDRLASRAQAALGSPGEGERILSRLLETQRRELSALEQAAADHLSAKGQGEEATKRRSNEATEGQPLGSANAIESSIVNRQSLIARPSPLEQRKALAESISARRREYEAVREELASTIQQLEALRAQPIRRSGSIDPAARRAAQEADVELTQDLKALTVYLAEIKNQLLEIWQGSSPVLDELVAAADAMCRLGETKGVRAARGVQRLSAEKLTETAAEYRKRLDEFARPWTREFVVLRSAEPDPYRAGVLDTHRRLTKLLGDMLFESVEPMSAMRSHVDTLSSEPNEAARHHALSSEATRRFHKLRTAHHRFEFAASDVKAINNFRLDAALKSARGLHKRTQRRIADIDQRIEAQAYERAVKQRDREIADLQQRIEQRQRAADSHVASMLEAQDRLTQTIPQADAFLWDQASAAELARRIERLRREIESTQTRIAEHVANRSSSVRPEAVTVVSRHVDGAPANLAQRFAYGWLAAATTVLLFLLGSRLVSGRRARG